MFVSNPNLLNGVPWNNKRIGLLGGSFNPAHKGHVHISLIAMKMLDLDAVWWLVTPQNPLKSSADLKSYDERFRYSKSLVRHPRIIVTDIERQLSSKYSYDTICALNAHFPNTNFVFITGMDNALNLHKWYKWKEMLSMISTVHIARPPAQNLIKACPLRMLSNHRHISLNRAHRHPLEPSTTFWIKDRKMMYISSTQIRNCK